MQRSVYTFTQTALMTALLSSTNRLLNIEHAAPAYFHDIGELAVLQGL